jgi:V/A-type H+-transporting ATPase subunit F
VKIYCVSDNVDTRTGLRLAGIDGVVCHTNDEIKEALNHILTDKEIGVLLITERLAGMFPETIKELRTGRSLPLVVEIPDRHGSGRSKEFITDYVREAIGVKL